MPNIIDPTLNLNIQKIKWGGDEEPTINLIKLMTGYFEYALKVRINRNRL